MKLKEIVIAMVMSLSLVGCATLGSLDRSAQQFTHDAIVQSEAAHDSGSITDAQFKALNVELNKVAVAGLTFTQLLEAGQATPETATQFLNLVIQETTIIRNSYPSNLTGNVLSDLIKLQNDLQKIIKKL
jgi:hypothetical protein